MLTALKRQGGACDLDAFVSSREAQVARTLTLEAELPSSDLPRVIRPGFVSPPLPRAVSNPASDSIGQAPHRFRHHDMEVGHIK